MNKGKIGASVICNGNGRTYKSSRWINVDKEATNPVKETIHGSPILEIEVEKTLKRTGEKYKDFSEVSTQEFSEYTAGMPTPEQIEQISRLLRQKTIFLEGEPIICEKRTTITDKLCLTTQFIREEQRLRNIAHEKSAPKTVSSAQRCAKAFESMQDQGKPFHETSEYIQE